MRKNILEEKIKNLIKITEQEIEETQKTILEVKQFLPQKNNSVFVWMQKQKLEDLQKQKLRLKILLMKEE